MAQKGEFSAAQGTQEVSFAPKADLSARSRLGEQTNTSPGMVPSVFGTEPLDPAAKAQPREIAIVSVVDDGLVGKKGATSVILNEGMDDKRELGASDDSLGSKDSTSRLQGTLPNQIAHADARRQAEEQRMYSGKLKGLRKNPRDALIEIADTSSTESDNQSSFNHPEIFENPESVSFDDKGEFWLCKAEGVGEFSLLKEEIGGEKWLQVNQIDLEGEALQTGGYGTDFYRYVLEHLPEGYTGLRSGNITNDRIHSIYRKLEANYIVQKIGNVLRPSGYTVKPRPADIDDSGELNDTSRPHDGEVAANPRAQDRSSISYAGEQLEASGNMTKGRSGREYLTFLGGLSGTLDYVRQSSSHVVLDIGAGTTRGISEIAESDDGQGLDFRATVMQEDENITNYLGNERTLLTSVEELEGVEDNSVGLAIGLNSIAYSTDPETAIASIDRVLVPGGVLKATFQDPEHAHMFVPMNEADAFVAALREKEYDVEIIKNPDEDTDVFVVLALKRGATVTAKDLLEADLQSLPTETEDEKRLKESVNRGYGIGLDLLGHLQSPSAEDINGAAKRLQSEFGYDETTAEKIQQMLLQRYLSSASTNSSEKSEEL